MSGEQLPPTVAKAAKALSELLSSPEYVEWDNKYNLTNDLVSLNEVNEIRNDILERKRMGRLNFSWYIQENVEKYPDDDALVFEGQTWSWRQLSTVVDRFAVWWASTGVKYKDPVAIIMSNSASFIFAWLGLVKSGGVPLFIDFNLQGLALQHVISVNPATAIMVEGRLAENVHAILSNLTEQPRYGVYAHGKLSNFPNCPFPLVHEDDLPRTDRFVPCPPAELEDLGLLLYTSGTTGLPKGWYTSHGKKQATSLTFARRYQIKHGDRVIVTTPLYHGTGSLVGFGASMSRGATTIILPRFSATTFWDTARKTKATHCVYVGEIPRYLMNQPPSPNDLNHNIHTFNGLGMRSDIWVPFKKRFGIKHIGEYWGQTESPFSHRNIQHTAADGSEPWANYLATLGPFAREAFRIKLVKQDETTDAPYRNPQGHFEEVKVGERGHFVVKIDGSRPFDNGYFNNEEATKKKIAIEPFGPGSGNWYMTGDIMRIDKNHGWTFMDRSGDTFRWKGENVATSSVEMAMVSYPGIKFCNVYGVKVPHQTDGKAGMAVTVIDPKDFDIEKLATYLSSHIPRYARPYWLRIRENDDINASGLFKLLKTELVNAAMNPEKADKGDKLFALDESLGKYVSWTQKDFEDLEAGKIGPGVTSYQRTRSNL